jgi:hypothetical protein
VIAFKPLTQQAEWDWIRERAWQIQCADSGGVVAYDMDKQTIIAGAVWDSFTIDACNVHIAIDNPMAIRRGFLSEVAMWVYVKLGRKRMFGLVPGNNEKALRFDKHIGFTEVCRIPDAIEEGVDYVVLRMKKEECRWLPPEYKEAA